MARNTASYRDASTYCVQFLGELADAPHGTAVTSNLCTQAEAFRFRKQLYKWRFLLKQALSRPGTPDHRDAAQWLTPIVGPRRASRDWLDLIIFQIIPEPDAPGAFRVSARAQPPLIGPDPFARADGAPDAADLIRRAIS